MSASSGRQPRFRITFGTGGALPISSGRIVLNRFSEAGTFEASTPLAATGMTLAQLNAIGKTDVRIEGSNDGASAFKAILLGVLDKINVRASAIADQGGGGVMVVFTGRDNTAKLIDRQRTQNNLNKSSAEIVKDIAARHGLKVDIDPTPGQAGQEHTQDFAHLVDNDSDWNTIVALAEREGAFLYVSGDTLYFKQAGNDGSLGSYDVRFSPPIGDKPADGNVMEIDLIENVHLAGGVTATVRAFRTREGETSESRQQGNGTGGAAPLAMTEHVPGLTDSQVEAAAVLNQTAAERHQMLIDVLMPGDVNINIRQMLTLRGTSSAWDQGYFIDTISHEFGAMTGYLMRIEAKNRKGS